MIAQLNPGVHRHMRYCAYLEKGPGDAAVFTRLSLSRQKWRDYPHVSEVKRVSEN